MVQLALMGTMEWVILVAVVVLLFGARKLPELARSMGTSITEFKKGLKDEPERRLPEGSPKPEGKETQHS